MLEKGTLVWVKPKVGDKEATADMLKKHGHLWRVDKPSVSDPDWVWCCSYLGNRTYDFHVSELTLHFDDQADQHAYEQGLER